MDEKGMNVVRFGYHNFYAVTVLNYLWVGARNKVKNLIRKDPVPKLFLEGGDRGGRFAATWREERLRQVMGLLAAHWCEWRVVEGGMDMWSYKEGFDVNEDFYHVSLRPQDDPSFPRNFLNVPCGDDNQPLAMMHDVPPSSLHIWHENGRGTWVRDVDIISLPDLFVQERDRHTAASLVARWTRMPIVSRREHQFRASAKSMENWRRKGKGKGKGKDKGKDKGKHGFQPLASLPMPPPAPASSSSSFRSQPLASTPPRPPPPPPPPPSSAKLEVEPNVEEGDGGADVLADKAERRRRSPSSSTS